MRGDSEHQTGLRAYCFRAMKTVGRQPWRTAALSAAPCRRTDLSALSLDIVRVLVSSEIEGGAECIFEMTLLASFVVRAYGTSERSSSAYTPFRVLFVDPRFLKPNFARKPNCVRKSSLSARRPYNREPLVGR